MDDKNTIFERLYLEYAKDLIRYCKRFVEDFSAEDIVQESFLEVYEKNFMSIPEDEIVKLLYTISRNKCIDQLRHQACINDYRAKKCAELALEELLNENVESISDKNDKLKRILLVAKELPQRRKEIFYLYYIKGMNSERISQTLSLSQRTVENSIYRALMFIRNKFTI